MSVYDPSRVGEACDQLDALCRKVGLFPAESLPISSRAARPPASAALWSGCYAHLLLWPVEDASPAAIAAGALEAEGWFDELLSQYEAKTAGRPLDGYLVLALGEAPGDAAKEEIRRLELSTRICRKHLIWPAEARDGETVTGGWRHLADVTVLGLPQADMAGVSELVWPEMDAEAAALWSELDRDGAATAAQKDAES